MQTDKIKVGSNENGRAEALKEAEKFSEYVGLSEKEALRVRLLTEETMGLVAAITGNFDADFWIESEDNDCKIHLLANTQMNLAKKEELVSISSSGKNEAAKGFMGKIRDIFENSFYNVEEVENLSYTYGGGPIMYASMGMMGPETTNLNSLVCSWSLNKYREALGYHEENPAVKEAWDELEKSIVASLADDVRVSVSGDNVEMVIEMKF